MPNRLPRFEDGTDDETLAQQASCDPDAFSLLYHRHLPRVYNYLLAHVGNVQDAQDLTAQTFMAVVERLPAYRSQNQFVGWLMSIARHKLVDHFRRHHDHVPFDVLPPHSLDTPPPDEAVEHQLQLEAVAAALQTLTPDRAEALTLNLFAGLSAAETGQIMHKSEDAVRMLVHRALRDLRERLAYEVKP
ncbi:MAG: RNA polymerase sigma factor [Chloroflexi bacterium]|nr:RNA polymerase sigma factor [Chloroflexota bacterium]